MAKHKSAHRKKNPKGFRRKFKGDKIHGQKKGKKGEAAAYITRAQALAKLQVPLADFRKLCILKGIYPRDPKKKNHGNDKTYYHAKDILFLSHEPLLNKFFELKTFLKKFKRLVGRREMKLAKGLEERKPQYTLHHLVRERYPSFDDAIRDLDDAVSMLALFASLSADQKRDIPTDAVNEATRLYQEFQLYVIRAQALRKIFASIKGYYFQAEIRGQQVTWLSPHQFAQELPAEVDFRVMLTFLEFYRASVKFVNYKLYSELGLEYPPRRDSLKDGASAEVAALEIEMKEAGMAREAQAKQGEEDDAAIASGVVEDFGDQSEEAVEMKRKLAEASRMKTTFRGLRVFINREVPLRPAYFALLCGGVDEVGWERGATAACGAGPGSAFTPESDKITHHIVDRPPDHIEQKPGREYVQPQWIFDSFNVGCLLPIAPYAPGRTPPPHLSPFVDDKAEGYVPRQREILDRLAAEASGQAVTAEESSSAPGVAAAPGTFSSFSEELKAEAKGIWHSAFREQQQERLAQEMVESVTKAEADEEAAEAAAKKAPVLVNPAIAREGLGPQPTVKPSEEEEERLRAKALMPKKHKRLLHKIEFAEGQKKDASDRLMTKRRKLEKAGKTA